MATVTIEDLESLRAQLDETLAFTRSLANIIARGTAGREVALVITKLQEAQMWTAEAMNQMAQSQFAPVVNQEHKE